MQGLLVTRDGEHVLVIDLVILAKLVMQVSVARFVLDRFEQKLAVAAFLVVELVSQIAIMAYLKRQPAERQCRLRVLVDAAGIANAARQQAWQPGASHRADVIWRSLGQRGRFRIGTGLFSRRRASQVETAVNRQQPQERAAVGPSASNRLSQQPAVAHDPLVGI